MTTTRHARTPRCPAPADLERAYWSDDPDLRDHAATCEACAAALADIEALAALARADEPTAADPDAREHARTALLASMTRPAAPARAARWPRRIVAVAGVALAAAAALAVWLRGDAGAPEPDAHRGQVLAHNDARYMVTGAQPDEIIRLVDGTITVDVAPLADGERLRVITRDAEVEVRGTAFDVSADDDRLTAVRVLHGVVEVRTASRGTRVLRDGESWVLELRADAGEPAPGEPAPGEPTAGDPTAGDPAAPEHTAPGATPEHATVEPARDATAGETAAAPERMRARPEVAPLAPAHPPAGPAQQSFDAAWRFIRAGAFADAADELRTTVTLAGDDSSLDADARYWLGVALARSGDAGAARTALEALLRVHRDTPRAGEVHVMLGWMVFEDGDYDAAEAHFERGTEDPSERIRARARAGLEAIAKAPER